MYSNRFFVCCIALLAGLIAVPQVSVAAETTWSKMSAAGKTRAILQRANRDLGKDVGVECKAWVQQVVREASGGTVVVPVNSPSATSWAMGPNISGACIPIKNVKAGQIIQMRWTNRDGREYPHTAIVVSVAQSSVTVIDSNWSGGNKVTKHSWSFADFDAATKGRYSVYTIL